MRLTSICHPYVKQMSNRTRNVTIFQGAQFGAKLQVLSLKNKNSKNNQKENGLRLFCTGEGGKSLAQGKEPCLNCFVSNQICFEFRSCTV